MERRGTAKLRWIAAGVLVAVGALAASWGMGLWRRQAPPANVAPPPAAAPAPAEKEVAPLRTAAWMLANSRPAARPTQPAPPNEDWACGTSGAACADDSVCIDGGCVSTVCADDGGSGVPCALPSGRIGACCGERCSDLEGDGANCGQCGVACLRGLDCVSGRCQARSCAGRMAGTLCRGPATGSGACCRNVCVDQATWASDPANCGGCGHACAPGLACGQGSCIDPGTRGPPSWTCMQEGHYCPEDWFCVIDACYPRACRGDNDGLLCLGPGERLLGHCCGEVCADLFADKSNCRACGVRCPAGQVCKNGECLSPDP